MAQRKRKGFSKRQRFEIFKRDGFLCTYCGATPMNSALRLDHVIPFSKGGSDDPDNLVTACFDCNAGKSNIELNDKKLSNPKIQTHDKDHIEQIKKYLELQKEIKEAKEAAVWVIADYWIENVGCISERGFSRLGNVMKTLEMSKIIEAIDIVARKKGDPEREFDGRLATDQIKYFNGILRKWRSE